MRVAIWGDTHGSSVSLDVMFEVERVDAHLVVGDFGYWPRRGFYQTRWAGMPPSFLQKAANSDTPVFFIDGNHEDHEALRHFFPERDRIHQVDVIGSNADFSDVTRVNESNLFYIPRGHRWVWGSTRCGALGGAFSIDREFNVKGESWFPEEVVTEEDVAALGDEPLDVLFTHEAPLGYEPQRVMPIPESATSRELVLRAIRATRPIMLVHGHWHVGGESMVDGVTHVVSLAATPGDSCFKVLDL